MSEIALLITALLFGGMVLYSFGFGAFVFKALPADTAGLLIRQAFPHFYLFVLITSGTAAFLTFFADQASSLILTLIAATTVFARQVLMPAINDATDSGATSRFRKLHSLSVIIMLAHTGGAAFVILRMVG